ncbi:hypothetical protein AVEN_248546-1 [Araneus ventricosus]|uniref:Uncharacterized protein n=1 Tax=Araneus ventricosus TaxID=182803 RepID=A0A4Y2H5R7_ARAVE|nr:hypothetical protein AVEN_248546-1 [Araneus ventricosus]
MGVNPCATSQSHDKSNCACLLTLKNTIPETSRQRSQLVGHSRAFRSTQIQSLQVKTGRQCKKPMRIEALPSEVWISNLSGYPSASFGLPGHKR